MYRVSCHEVRTCDVVWLRLFLEVRDHGSDSDLDLLGCDLSHLDVVLLTEVHLDVVCEYVTGNLDRVLDYDTAERDHCDLCSTTSDVNDHVTLRRLHIEADTEGRCHWLVDQIYVASSCVLSRVTYRTDLHFGTSRRDADHDLEVRLEQRSAFAVHLLDESTDHHLRSVEVCDDTILERTDCLDARILSFLHELRLLSESESLASAVVDCYDTWLVKHDLVVLEDDRIRCSEVDRKLLCQK